MITNYNRNISNYSNIDEEKEDTRHKFFSKIIFHYWTLDINEK